MSEFSAKNSIGIFQNPEDLKLFVDAKVINNKKAVLIRGSGVDMSHFIHIQIRALAQAKKAPGTGSARPQRRPLGARARAPDPSTETDVKYMCYTFEMLDKCILVFSNCETHVK